MQITIPIDGRIQPDDRITAVGQGEEEEFVDVVGSRLCLRGLSMFNSIFPNLTHVDLDVQATQFLAKAFWSRDRRAQGGFYNDMMKLGDE